MASHAGGHEHKVVDLDPTPLGEHAREESQHAVGGSNVSMNEELHKLLKRLNEGHKESAADRFWSLFMHPFFWAAVLTGALSWLTSRSVHNYQQEEALHALERQHAAERLKAQQAMLSTFGREFPASLYKAYSMEYRALELRAKRKNKDASPEAAKAWSAESKEWEDLAADYLKAPNPLSLCSEVGATFDTDDTFAAAIKLRATIDQLLNLRDSESKRDSNGVEIGITEQNYKKLQDDLNDLNTKANAQYLALLDQMGTELRRKAEAYRR